MEDEKICPICYDDLDSKKDIVKLLCGHKFHYECILLIYKNAKLSYMHNKKKIRRCPFCRMDGGYLPLILPQVPLNGIHVEYVNLEIFQNNNNWEAIEQYFNRERCHTILKSGKNMGNQCSRRCIKNIKFCKIHNTDANSNADSSSLHSLE
jgi:hypothetical protein